ncbi:glutamate-5-semialdehyde dehydrogenase [Thermoplasmatales archaeon BRNA1]|nr:glutamate-5-semialdehyde dehydrogenase [Thermoplasmatales archaeon BRNA1]
MTDTVTEIKAAKTAALKMAALTTEVKDRALQLMAEAVDSRRKEILDANAEDVREAEGKIPAEMLKRLKVNDAKVDEMIASLNDVKKQKDPVGETMRSMLLDDGLTLYQVRCPIGLIGIVFEARPDVIPQIMSLCLKSGNAVCFKGGSEAKRSNRALFDILREAAGRAGVPEDGFVLLESREEISEILKLDEYIDLMIPRGSYGFVRYIKENTRIPVLGHAAGVCHVYVDSEADLNKAFNVAYDSKVQYPAVCNAAEKLLVNEKIASFFLPRMADLYAEAGVEMRVDAECKKFLIGFDVKDITEDDYTAEYDDLIIAIRMVRSAEEAIDIMNTCGSHHTEAIITENRATFDKFVKNVDSADIVMNASTRFADGFRLGMGAEVGISTNKVHARGPMGMEGLMIYKYVIIGSGQVVRDYVGKDAKPYKHQPLNERYE